MTNFFKAAPDIRKKPRRMKRVSQKRVIINAKRAEFVAEQLAKRPYCEALRRVLFFCGHEHEKESRIELQSGCTQTATEIHEPLTRARRPGADNILDADNTLALCSRCHFWCHAHPALSEKMGLLKSSRGLT